MHTPLCRHATGEPAELAAQAVKLGLPEIGFSEHNPMIRDDYDDWRRLRKINLNAIVSWSQVPRLARSKFKGLVRFVGYKDQNLIPCILDRDWLKD